MGCSAAVTGMALEGENWGMRGDNRKGGFCMIKTG